MPYLKIIELQKQNLSKKEIFDKLRTNTIDDIFLSKELAQLPEWNLRKKYSWAYNFYISIYFIKIMLLAWIIPYGIWDPLYSIVSAKDGLLLGFVFNFYFWKIWNQYFLIVSIILSLVILAFTYVTDSKILNEYWIDSLLLLDVMFNLFLNIRIFGSLILKKLSKDQETGLYEF